MDMTLFERLGGAEAITRIISDLVDLHVQNPRIAPRFTKSDTNQLKRSAASFFIAGSGGPNNYTGRDMLSAHKGMNIDAEEFVAVLDDALNAMEKNGVGQREKEGVLYILYSMRRDVIQV
jgi:hemoglobin